MTKKITGLLSIVAISALTIGCGSSSATPVQAEPSEVTAPTATGTTTTTLTSSQINAGVTTTPVTVSVTTTDNQGTADVTLATGTAFEDVNGTKLENVTPSLNVVQEVGSSTENSSTTKTVQTTIKLTDAQGNKLVPTEAVTVKIKAPSNAKPGDEVRVSVPDGVNSSTKQEKLIIVIVAADGTISFAILPNVFRGQTAILIIVEKTTVSGAAGGN